MRRAGSKHGSDGLSILESCSAVQGGAFRVCRLCPCRTAQHDVLGGRRNRAYTCQLKVYIDRSFSRGRPRMRASSMKSELDSCAFSVNEFLLSQLEGKPKALYQASSHYIRSGGKRLRPCMVIKSCELLGGTIKRALPAAGAVELVHNFTLVHDDIMDNDEMRHGVATVHHQYGLPLAILGGDILFSKAFEILSYNGRKVGINEKEITEMVGRLANSCTVICEGQTIDIDFASNAKFPSEAQYIDMIGKKTAALFEVSCAIGALSSPNPSDKDVDNLASFGRHIGVAFQLVDDL